MPDTCTFILPSGRACGCIATRNQPVCRHHGAPPVPRSLLRPCRSRNRPSCIARWRDLGRAVSALTPAEILGEIDAVFHALLCGEIADRTAGRLLRAFFRRLGTVPLQPISGAASVPQIASVSVQPAAANPGRQPSLPQTRPPSNCSTIHHFHSSQPPMPHHGRDVYRKGRLATNAGSAASRRVPGSLPVQLPAEQSTANLSRKRAARKALPLRDRRQNAVTS